MTAAEWNASADPQAMLSFLRYKASDRKLRLLGVECCRHVWHLLAEGLRGRKAVEVAELIADGNADERVRLAAEKTAREYTESLGENTGPWVGRTELPAEAWAAQAAAHVVDVLGGWFGKACLAVQRARALQGEGAGRSENEAQARLLRCLFRRPFRSPLCLNASLLSWNDDTVLRIAQAIYDSRRFEDLPILADALEEADCDNQEVLFHCREQGGVHARGCWVLDLLLGKE